MALLLSVIVVAIGLAFFAAPLWAWFVALGVLLLVTIASVVWWVIAVALAVVLLHKPTRVKLITQNLFNSIEKNGLLPKISDTEKTALRVWRCVGGG